jgi:dethiobiotin synthetase
MKRYFITGTNTDCGKTYVTSKLVEFFTNASAIKPIASGGNYLDNKFVSYDAQYLQPYSNLAFDVINPWCFKLPVSPHIASKEEGYSICINKIADYCLNIQLPDIEILFIEGAGGLMVPLNDNETWIDFLHYSDIPVILVVGMKLGCINHALLTETAFNAHKINCVGWIANCLDPDMLAISENICTLKSLLKIPLLATIPYSADLLDENLHLL